MAPIASVILLALLGRASSFAPIAAPSRSPSTTARDVLVDPSLVEEMNSARGAFGMCFFGAAGVGSIGRELIPIVFGRYQSNQALPTAAVSPAGEDTGIRGYPQTIYRDDVEAILNNPITASAMANKFKSDDVAGPRFEYTHMAKTPFLTYEAFVLANPRANPVALRAVFDSFSNSIGGGNTISPITAQQRIDLYKSDLGAMSKKLNSGKAIGIASFLFVLVLLGLADYLALYHLWRGWFPEWQGFSNMPASLFASETGIATLPKFFVGDVPSV